MITILQPDLAASPGRFPRWARQLRCELRMIPLLTADDVPHSITQGDSVIILGGRMNAHSDRDNSWLPPLMDFIDDCVSRDIPTVAVCLGAQVAARTLGGTVLSPAPEHDEVGLVPWLPTSDADTDVLVGPALRAAREAGRGATFPVCVSHHDAVVELPADATLLASSPSCPIHTWRYGSVLAFQHHPEMTATRCADLVAREAILGGAGPAEAKRLWYSTVSHASQVEEMTQSFGLELMRALDQASS